MSSQKAGRESPEPERQTGSQQQDAPSSGQGVGDKGDGNKTESQKTLDGLSSNPKGPLDDHAKEVRSKDVGNTIGA